MDIIDWLGGRGADFGVACCDGEREGQEEVYGVKCGWTYRWWFEYEQSTEGSGNGVPNDAGSSEVDWECSSYHYSSDSEVEYVSMNGTNSQGEGEGEGRMWSVKPMGGWDAHCDGVEYGGEGGNGSCEGIETRCRGRVGVGVPVGGEDVEFFLT
ncbi:hypothetical protein BJ165DRAFT_1599290 [Panaeolus papilionaceus]|nr:hypothetical protein BJ165DRAFT_1599290 [Panaeolus papilionaceus]